MRQAALLFAASVAASVFVAGIARAQNKAAAEAAFDHGRSLAASGDVAAACAKFEESERAEPAVGTLLNLADCNEKLGRIASAWAALKEAAARAELGGEHPRALATAARAEALEGSLSRLQVVAPEPRPEGIQIRRDGVVLGDEVAGTPVPVDPGAHVIEAVVAGAVRWSRRIDVPKGPSLVVALVPQLEAAPSHPDATLPRVDVDRTASATVGRRSPSASPLAGLAISPAAAWPTRPGLGEPPKSITSPELWTLVRSPQETVGVLTLAGGGGGLVSAAVAGIGAIVAKSDNDRPRALGWAQAFDWIVVPSAIAALAGTLLLVTSPHRSSPVGLATARRP